MTIFSKSIKAIAASALLMGAVSANADALSAKPLRVGPVQNYGALGTNGGKIVSQKTGSEVMVRGMSMFWSDATGIQYYNKEVIKWAVENRKMDVVRYAMGINCYNSDGSCSNKLDEKYSYIGNSDLQKNKIDQMVEAAIENDIYIIIDWHSHRAYDGSEKSQAKSFFSEMAKKYKDVPNIIWEVFNEPAGSYNDWGQIKSYASDVIGGIRSAGSKNLALVGTPEWSQMGQCGGVSGDNIGYVFHFYAASHSVGSYSGRVSSCKNGGNAVFITEWGTTDANGSGSTNTSAASEWENFMEQNKISNCNWSLRNAESTIGEKTNEASAMFKGTEFLTSQAALASAQYTTSGEHVKKYLTSHATDWAQTLVSNKNTGNCAFKAATVKESDGSAASSLKSGCTYTSSDENVVTSAGAIKGAGYAIMTGNDGSQSVITVTAVPRQTLSGFVDFNCYVTESCSKNKTFKDLDQNGKMDVLLTVTGETDQGASVTIKSLNESVAKVKKATCSAKVGCYGAAKGATVTMLEFSGTMGEAKLVATANAVTGYAAMNDTITVQYTKTGDKIGGNFKNMTVEKGSLTANVFPSVTEFDGTPITYTFDGKESTPYLANNQGYLTAGTEDAIVVVTALAAETSQRAETKVSITIIVGDSATAVQKGNSSAEPIIATKARTSFGAQFVNDGIVLSTPNSGIATVEVFTTLGQKAMADLQASVNAGTTWIPVDGLTSGRYVVRIRQGSAVQYFNWNKQ